MHHYMNSEGRMDWQRACALLDEAEPLMPLVSGPCLIVTMWLMEDITRAPIECSIEIEKVAVLDSTGKVIRHHFHFQDYEGNHLDDTNVGLSGKNALELASRILDAVDTSVLQEFICEMYQVDHLKVYPARRIDNTIYQYYVTAELSQPPCYVRRGMSMLCNGDRSGNGDTLRGALESLAQTMGCRADDYQSRQDPFQIPPFKQWDSNDNRDRCRGCGAKLTREGKWLCPNGWCPFHTHLQTDEVDD